MPKGKAFKGFSDTQMKRIAEKLGYNGPVSGFKKFLQSNPAMANKFTGLEEKARMKFAVGGMPIGGGLAQKAMSNFVKNQDDFITNAAQNNADTPKPASVADYNTSAATMPMVPSGAMQSTPTDNRTATPQQLQTMGLFNASNQQQQFIPQRGNLANTGFEQDIGIPDITPMPIVPSPTPGQQPAQAVPSAPATSPFQDYQQKQNEYMENYLSQAPDNIKNFTSRQQDATKEIQQKYATAGKEVKDLFDSKYGERLQAATTLEERRAIDEEIQADTEFQTARQSYEQMLENDPLVQEMRRDQQAYQEYMQQGAQAFQQDNPAPSLTDVAMQRMVQPGVPQGGEFQAAKTEVAPEQFVDPTTGQITSLTPSVIAGTAPTAQADAPVEFAASKVDAAKSEEAVRAETEKLQAAKGEVSEEAQVKAQTQDPTSTDVGTISPAEIKEATKVEKPASRTLQSGETVQAAADAQKATGFVEQVEAAQANPSAAATVQGQLENLMADFEGGETPPWAAGAMRAATAQMAARGLTSSSLAGQAIIQATMESALPIAQADAQTQARFEELNLSNRQARAMLAAEQRAAFMGMEFTQEFQARVTNAAKISDIANMNFNAEQQIAIENARLASTVDLANLDSNKAMTLAEAAQIANLETSNLNNRQQAAVQNAKSFLEMDMTNLSNEQQTTIFKAQQTIQSLLADTAVENASRQFNASSENQVNQFFANLASQINQYNATQTNAMSQFNEGNEIDVQKFNSQIQEARDQFNAQNQLVIAQSNVQWRRDIGTADTLAINASNEFNARNILDMSNQAYDNLWQTYSDVMEYAWRSGESERDRINDLMRQQLANDGAIDMAKIQANASDNQALGGFFARALFGSGGLFG